MILPHLDGPIRCNKQLSSRRMERDCSRWIERRSSRRSECVDLRSVRRVLRDSMGTRISSCCCGACAVELLTGGGLSYRTCKIVKDRIIIVKLKCTADLK